MTCGADTDICGACLNDKPEWDKLFCAADYDFPMNTLLHDFKYRGKFWLAEPLTSLLSEKITQPADLLLPVPMHWQRRFFRGYNQSALLTRSLAKMLKTKWCPDVIKRIKATPAQRGLKRSQRLSNLASAFEVRNDVLPPHIAIVDDVVTTGSTVSILCQLLRQQGAQRIDVYCLCRTAKYRDI
ncbi:amidophosphoribosyltransferase [Veronia nyctiphanis]|uniref:Amidophosphoribosyltransferase n=1 Tax=Veronia nyctiphanis TaxID=1278244 RepID=A0A4V1LSW1_9GAMM|nr:amidophosphoribosyltransferase [Veronia nyctiphanis]